MKRLLLSSVLLSLFAAPAIAGSLSSEYGPKVKVQANVNHQSANFNSIFNGGVNKDNGSFGIFVGGKITHYFGYELGYTSLGTVYGNTPQTVQGRGKFFSYAIPLRVKASYPVGKGFNVNAKLGFAYVRATHKDENTKTSSNSIRPTYGVGASYDVTRKFSLTLDVDRYQSRKPLKVNTVQYAAGFQYKF